MNVHSKLARQFLSVAEKGDQYGRKPVAASTLQTYTHIIKRVENIAKRPFEEWDETDLPVLYTDLAALDFRPSTIRSIGNVLRVMFRWAAEEGILNRPNPIRGAPTVDGDPEGPVVISPKQAEEVIDTMSEILHERRESASDIARRVPSMDERFIDKYAFLFRFSYYAGIPLRQVLELQKADVETDGVWVTTKHRTKVRRTFRKIPKHLLGELRQYIAEHPHTDYVFYGESGAAYGGSINRPMNPGQAYILFDEARERTDLSSRVTPRGWASGYENWLQKS
jgi:integrase